MELDVEQAKRILYDHNRAHIGNMELESIEPGFSRSTVTIDSAALNVDGGAFGGFLMALADVAASTIPWSYGKHSVTQSIDLHFVRGVSGGDRLLLEARGVHVGRTSCVVDVTVTDEAGKVRLTATATMHVFGDIEPGEYEEG